MSNKTIPWNTVHSHCQRPTKTNCLCPPRPFPATLYTVSNKTIPYHTVHSQCPTRPFPTTLYTVSVQQDHSLLYCTQSVSNKTIPYYTVFNMTIPYNTEHSVQQDHYLLRCTQWPPRARSTTLYTVSVQQDHFLWHCTQPVSKKIIPYYLVIVSSKTIPCYTVHCQCLTRPFFATQPVSKKTVPYYIAHSVQKDHSLLHSQFPKRLFHTTLYTVSNKTIPYNITHSTVSVHQDHSLL